MTAGSGGEFAHLSTFWDHYNELLGVFCFGFCLVFRLLAGIRVALMSNSNSK